MQKSTSPAIIKKIKKMWSEGKTGGQIADAIGKTRGSVMGILYRIRQREGDELVRVGERNKFKKGPQIKNKRILREVKMGLRPEPEIPSYAFPPKTNGQEGLTILQLKMNSCRYIIREDDAWNTFYCGVPRERGAYCEDHAKLCYVAQPTGKERKKHRNVFVLRASC